jgi:hypothetical protein
MSWSAPRSFSTLFLDKLLTGQFKHPNHSQQSYDFLKIMLPNWKKFKLQLEQKLV